MPDRLALTERIARDFTYHKPTPDLVPLYELIRQEARNFALVIANNTPESREQSLALTHLEEAVFWANASIARSTQ